MMLVIKDITSCPKTAFIALHIAYMQCCCHGDVLFVRHFPYFWTVSSCLGAIPISITLILLFGEGIRARLYLLKTDFLSLQFATWAIEIIPQSVCSRYGLAIGAAVAPFVRVLVWICFPIAYPISKLLDFLLGHGHVALFRRTELKTLVDLHGNEAGKGGELTHDETTIIAGALGLTEKIASDAMTPISDTFAVDINAKLDRELMNLILEKGHRRVPVYYEQPTNIIGLLLKLDRSTLECVRLQERNMALANELATLKLARGHQINAFVFKFKEQGMKMKFRFNPVSSYLILSWICFVDLLDILLKILSENIYFRI
ncbi:DUF21 domain-containing protein [Camellia lanceoleosa]|uniref:DUF21 domain-containing protein n=1 Tax=Camellia lanceoleosa TaxID=1840588 RepID=A0ACC0FCJ1_9ERIC|nr:DUF21 domain-containing protein [Camellia lanceoleosa]